MIKRSIVAFLLFSVAAAACDDSPTLPRPDASRDVRPADAGSDARSPDAGAVPDARDSAADTPVVDAPTPDGPASDGASPDGAPGADGAVSDAAAPDTSQSPDGADAALPDSATPDTALPPDLGIDAGNEAGTITGMDAAATDAAFSCQGASRDQVCMGYCQLVTFLCTGVNAQFLSLEACLTFCADPTMACGTAGELSGNSVACRGSQLVPAVVNPAILPLACVNAGPASFTCR